MEKDTPEKEKLEALQHSIQALREEKERFKSQKCETCIHFILYKHELYAGNWGYCVVHDRNVGKDQARYPWCHYEVRQ